MTVEFNFNAIDPGNSLLNEFLCDCRNYSLDEYNQARNFSHSNLITLLNLNIRSYSANGPPFHGFIGSLEESPNFVIVTETWNSDTTAKLCHMTGYVGHHTYRTLSREGGVSIFVKDAGYTVTKCDDLSYVTDDIETCVVQVRLTGSDSILIFGFYRPPSGSAERFVENIEHLLEACDHPNFSLIMLAGDANIAINSSSTISNYYMSCLQSFGFVSAIDKPTRFPSNISSDTQASCLDHIFFNKLTYYASGVISLDISDHCPTFLKLPTDLCIPKKPNLMV